MTFIAYVDEAGLLHADPDLDREKLLTRIADQALRLNDQLLRERPRKRRKRDAAKT